MSGQSEGNSMVENGLGAAREMTKFSRTQVKNKHTGGGTCCLAGRGYLHRRGGGRMVNHNLSKSKVTKKKKKKKITHIIDKFLGADGPKCFWGWNHIFFS